MIALPTKTQILFAMYAMHSAGLSTSLDLATRTRSIEVTPGAEEVRAKYLAQEQGAVMGLGAALGLSHAPGLKVS